MKQIYVAARRLAGIPDGHAPAFHAIRSASTLNREMSIRKRCLPTRQMLPPIFMRTHGDGADKSPSAWRLTPPSAAHVLFSCL